MGHFYFNEERAPTFMAVDTQEAQLSCSLLYWSSDFVPLTLSMFALRWAFWLESANQTDSRERWDAVVWRDKWDGWKHFPWCALGKTITKSELFITTEQTLTCSVFPFAAIIRNWRVEMQFSHHNGCWRNALHIHTKWGNTITATPKYTDLIHV